uniref:Coat protein 2 n=1 Tax=Japanese plum-yew deltapartitivirus TaxID=2933090 RepID=A0A9C7GX07_9VIRU|nr:putative coat protein 2 [Japanese plum-yew deltapartitivirus]CAI5383909.1 putative coat protein 2 [Japanese plum-yew deltapartitivirus]
MAERIPMQIEQEAEGSHKRELEASRKQPDTSLVVYSKRQKSGDKDTSKDAATAGSVIDYVPKRAYQVTADVNPNFILDLKSNKELGYFRPINKIKSKVVFIELKIATIREIMTAVFRDTLIQRFMRQGRTKLTSAIASAVEVSPIVCDAVMIAIYAKLRYIHKQHGEHSKRYSEPPSYTKDIELPLPFAIAVQDLGTFESRDVEERCLYIPGIPEGTTNECRKEQKWSSFTYQCYIPTLKELGIPFKSVNINLKNGSPWWTYKVLKNAEKLDLVCPLPPLHYSPHSASVRAIFLKLSEKIEDDDIIAVDNLTLDYGTMLREAGIGYNVRAFQALCHAPERDWNPNMV